MNEQVSAWSIEDVCEWLKVIKLGQYQEAFREASIDGSILYDLNENVF